MPSQNRRAECRLLHPIVVLSAIFGLFLSVVAAQAHEIRPAVVTLVLSTPDRYELSVATNIEALLVGIGDRHKDTDDAPEAQRYNELRGLPTGELQARFAEFAARWLAGVTLIIDGGRQAPRIVRVEVPTVHDLKLARISTVRLEGAIPPNARSVSWAYAEGFGSSVFRVRRGDGELSEHGWLRDGAASAQIPLAGAEARSTLLRFVDYLTLGFTHILPKGLDHILFVLGLYFLGTGWRPLLLQVTAFTVAHSVTLALGLYGVVAVSPAIVEPLIALSIVYVAVENALTSAMTPWRPFVVFGFGLLHGLGFAGILSELDLPRTDYVTALVGFNIGVEFGQLAVITIAWVATGIWFKAKPWYRARVSVPASLVIAAFGLYWTVERVFFTA